MAELFDDPTEAAAGDRVEMKVFINKLIIVRPKSYRDDMVTIHTALKPNGVAEAVFANIALLEPYEGEPYKVFRGVLVMQGYLIGAFKGSLNRNLLGTLYLGPPTKGKPPFHFKSLKDNPVAVERGQAWMATHADELLADPEPQFDEPGTGKSTLDTMRAEANPWMEEPPF